MQTERITILASPTEKRTMAARASARGVSMGEYLRRKGLDDEDNSPEEEAALATVLKEFNEAMPKMNASIERMIATLEQSHRENDDFLRKMGVR